MVIGTDSIGSCTSRHSKHHKITKQTTINAVISILPVASFYSHIYTACGLILQSYLYCLWSHSTVIAILPVASFYSHIYTALWPHSTVISILHVVSFYSHISILPVASFYSHIYTACGLIYSHIYTACGLILQS